MVTTADGEVRKRKNRPSNASGGKGGQSGSRKGSGDGGKSGSIDRGFTGAILTLAFMLTAGVVVLKVFPHHVHPSVHKSVNSAFQMAGLEQKVHAVVFDAGSTGTRLLAFTFHRGVFDGRLHLDDELWLEVKPGLSAYADDPAAAAGSVRGLLEQAKARIPEPSWASTPVTLKATAGLRLLPKEKSERIIGEVAKALFESGLKPVGPEPIEIMNPMEEGLFAWMTVNILSERLAGSLGDSFATLDLGGGSTQITFAPKMLPDNLEGRKHFLHNVSVMGSHAQVYSHSYLGLGLMAARESVFKQSSGGGMSADQMISPCVNSEAPLAFNFGGNSYQVSSAKDRGYENCAKLVDHVVSQIDVHLPTELAGRDIAAFSYFFDRALEREMIPKTTEGVVFVSDFAREAKKACDPKAAWDFHCVDLTIISSLLSNGYGLPHDKELYLLKKINGHETSWALGLAYNILENQ